MYSRVVKIIDPIIHMQALWKGSGNRAHFKRNWVSNPFDLHLSGPSTGTTMLGEKQQGALATDLRTIFHPRFALFSEPYFKKSCFSVNCWNLIPPLLWRWKSLNSYYGRRCDDSLLTPIIVWCRLDSLSVVKVHLYVKMVNTSTLEEHSVAELF